MTSSASNIFSSKRFVLPRPSDCSFGFEAIPIIWIKIPLKNDAVLANKIAPWHWQFKTLLSIAGKKINTKALVHDFKVRV